MKAADLISVILAFLFGLLMLSWGTTTTHAPGTPTARAAGSGFGIAVDLVPSPKQPGPGAFLCRIKVLAPETGATLLAPEIRAQAGQTAEIDTPIPASNLRLQAQLTIPAPAKGAEVSAAILNGQEKVQTFHTLLRL